MWLTGPVVLLAAEGGGVPDTGNNPTALIISATLGGLAAVITAVSLLIRNRSDRTAPSPPSADPLPAPGAPPAGERIATLEERTGGHRSMLNDHEERIDELEAWRREEQWRRANDPGR